MDRKQLRQERSNLLRLVLFRLFSGLLLIGGLLFAFAGSFRYWQAWLFLAALAIPLVMTLTFLLRKDPVLLEKRMNLKEPRKEQRKIVQISGLFMLLGLFSAGIGLPFSVVQCPDLADCCQRHRVRALLYDGGRRIRPEQLCIPRHRNPGRTAVDRYRALFDHPPPNVFGFHHPVSVDSADARVLRCRDSDGIELPRNHRADQRRGGDAESRASRLHSLYPARQIPPDPLHLVSLRVWYVHSYNKKTAR